MAEPRDLYDQCVHMSGLDNGRLTKREEVASRILAALCSVPHADLEKIELPAICLGALRIADALLTTIALNPEPLDRNGRSIKGD